VTLVASLLQCNGFVALIDGKASISSIRQALGMFSVRLWIHIDSAESLSS
jgi:hypothetical protein